MDRNVRKIRIPHKGGRWSDREGDSEWIPDDHARIYVGGKKGWTTGLELRRKYNFNSIAYTRGEPDFFPFADRSVGRVRLESVPGMRRGATGSYAQARRAVVRSGRFRDEASLRRYMKAKDLVWHECGDGHTMIAVPREINRAFPHTGAIGIARGLDTLWRRLSSGRRMALSRGSFTGKIVRSTRRS